MAAENRIMHRFNAHGQNWTSFGTPHQVARQQRLLKAASRSCDLTRYDRIIALVFASTEGAETWREILAALRRKAQGGGNINDGR